jgi:parallel beta-helix repeat protein
VSSRTRAGSARSLCAPTLSRRAFLRATTAALVATSLAGGRPQSVTPEHYGALADGRTDDTAALTAAARAAAGGTLDLPAGAVYSTQGVRLLPGTTLRGSGAALRAAPQATESVLTVTHGCSVVGVEIDGARDSGARAACLTARDGSAVSISDVYLHDAGGSGLTLDHVADYIVRNVRVSGVAGPGIQAVFSNRGQIISCSVDTAQHGIQLWGGDAANASTSSTIDSVAVRDCQVRNVRGGIWAARGTNITISRNVVHTCSDVGIDFEGCTSCSATDNTVTDATHATLAVFYASSDCAFLSNLVTQGRGMGPGFRVFGHGVSRRITVQGNSFNVGTAPPCQIDPALLVDSSVDCPS